MTTEDLIEAARRDIADADRCAALHVTPAVHQLHRRLREVTDALAALSSPPTDDVREAVMRELHHFEVEQQLAETIAIVKRARAAVLRNEHTPASMHMDSILEEVNTDIPSGIEVRPRGPVTETEVEAAAKAMFEDPIQPGDGYTWAQMATDDSSRADIWRADARRVLEAARKATLVSAENTRPTNHADGSTR